MCVSRAFLCWRGKAEGQVYTLDKFDRRGNGKLSKRATLYLCHQYTRKWLKEIGAHFGVGESSVSQASRRIALQLHEDTKLRKQIEKIKRELSLSRV